MLILNSPSALEDSRNSIEIAGHSFSWGIEAEEKEDTEKEKEEDESKKTKTKGKKKKGKALNIEIHSHLFRIWGIFFINNFWIE